MESARGIESVIYGVRLRQRATTVCVIHGEHTAVRQEVVLRIEESGFSDLPRLRSMTA